MLPSHRHALGFTEYTKIHELKQLQLILSYIETRCKKYGYDRCKILDIGCGRGNITLPIASLGCSILAIDINRDALDYAKHKNCFTNACFLCADAEHLVLKERFDFIICAEIFEHLSQPDKLAKVLTTILRDDGLVIITIPNGYGPWELILELPTRVFLKLYWKFKNIKNFQPDNYTVRTSF